MVLPPIKIDEGIKQFQVVRELHKTALLSLISLVNLHPEHGHIWEIIIFRLNLIQQSLESNKIPTLSKKKQAELGTMLIYECPEMSGTGELTSFFKLDNAYQRLGIKPLNRVELNKFNKEMRYRI